MFPSSCPHFLYKSPFLYVWSTIKYTGLDFFSGIYPRYLWFWMIQLGCTTGNVWNANGLYRFLFSCPYFIHSPVYSTFSLHERIFKVDQKRYPLSWKLLARFLSFSRLVRKDFCGKKFGKVKLRIWIGFFVDVLSPCENNMLY